MNRSTRNTKQNLTARVKQRQSAIPSSKDKEMAKPKARRAKAADTYHRFKLDFRSDTQEELGVAIVTSDIVFAFGPAGCGKTFCVSALAADALDAGEIDRVIITRPVIQAAGEDLGYLPGTMEEKMDPYLKPILDVFQEVWEHDRGRYETLMETRRIEVSPLAFSRGRTFKNAWVICDEAQNMTDDDVRMLLTRLGEGSKIILCGDPTQRDRRHARGWEAAKNFLMDCPGVSFVTFSMNDIVRHQTVSEVLKRWASPVSKPEIVPAGLTIAS